MSYTRYKMCIFGDGGVGKTTLINRYISGKYSEDFRMTIGVDLKTYYVIGASGGIFMYDISRFYSLTHLEDWINLLNKAPDRREEKLPILLVGGKKDLVLLGKRVVEEDYASELGKKFGVFDFIECSSKTGENVELIFHKMALKMLESSGLL